MSEQQRGRAKGVLIILIGIGIFLAGTVMVQMGGS